MGTIMTSSKRGLISQTSVHSLSPGRVNQEGDERGGCRTDAVQSQHGVFALFLADHVI